VREFPLEISGAKIGVKRRRPLGVDICLGESSQGVDELEMHAMKRA
jgi:hypothetical protein